MEFLAKIADDNADWWRRLVNIGTTPSKVIYFDLLL
jgi:hypothetical protein